ncbi:hypothetical protein C900_04971 [Fulvivirga imtechensis AK7]|uniref:histidine kinase n=1 Tax=Fulvivirga imtechensis AK7 TaxID=1237149 RepID=L8JPJ6_9BACT|nr:sensor histidine kinase [Fulvivirga imtechensis]ELR69439.1 hypothetical protein C900_04971 [Fulvivirga imtechensis AK7]
MALRIVLLALLHVISVGPTGAQYNNDVFFDYIKAPGTLLNNSVNDIVQDQTGLIWFCSNDGLHRYDGYEIITYHYKRKEKDYALNNQINGLYITNDSTIFLATEHSGLLKFNPLTQEFVSIPFEGEPISRIREVISDGKDVLWLNCGFKGLYFLDKKQNKVVKKTDLPVNKLTLDDAKKLYISTNYLIGQVTGNTFLPHTELPRTAGNIITALEYIDGEVWIGTSNNGVYVRKNQQLVNLDFDRPNTAAITGFLKDKSGNIWITTRGGLYLKSGNQIRGFYKEYYVEKTLSNDHCLTSMMDKSGMIWIGTATGISTYDKYKSQFKHFIHKPYDGNSLSDNMIRGLYEDSDQNIWICTNDEYLNLLDSSRTKIKHIKVKIDQQQPVIPYSVYQINKHRFLIGTSAGLLNYNAATNEFSMNRHLTPEILEGGAVRQIVPLNKENQVLCMAGDKVFVLDFRSGYVASITNLILDKRTPIEGYMHNKFKSIYVSEDGEAWLGTYGVVARLSDNFEKIEYFPFEKWQGHMILSMIKHNEYLWIGTYDGGLVRLDPKTGNVKKYMTDDGLENNVVYATIPDELGNLWISSNNGVSQFNIANETFINFTKEDGLQNQEFNRLAFLKTARGEIVFGGINGVNIIDPERISQHPSVADANLLELAILNELNAETKMHPTVSLLGKEEITLPYDHNFLQFRYFATHFATPSKNQFYYQLENYDKNWINSGYQNTATYTGLKPGRYVFKVKGINPDGLESPEHASIIVNIRAPFWMTWWFYVTIILLGLGTTFALIKRKMEKDAKLQKHLEGEIARRTDELKKSKEELSQLNSKKDFIFSILSHDLRSPLTTLEGFLGVLINNYDFMNSEEIKKHAITIKSSVANSLDLIDNTLYWSLSQMGNITHDPVSLNLSGLSKTVFNLYQLTAERKGICFQLEVENDIYIEADENMIYIVIRNLVSNAIKFTAPSKKVVLKVWKNTEHALVSVIDEGEGIRSEDMEKLFDQSHTHRSKGTSNEKGTGLGLVLCKRFTEINGGKLTLKSKHRKGSTFTVQFPLQASL